ncbi:ATPase components of ABC transporters with duplicated ATPase domains [Arthrobacter subterraneus]|uniref:ATPase components of ABC transporters with duplicated ATPase domains n=1 Tax=Arthrobacter subterraneus TaxID=335973 RepID=A0A1G8J711_9MICC|nr:ABC-F family ATP-binding cassette domain-containing protein [Arthrobacter subterraneus]SDI26813.1 ATPase components of ABC transporters with duplicated ATPase domains [Arthrobacter subterraneus]
MAHLLGAENISITFATRTVLDGVTLGIEEGDRIGMVGRNGDGKSTLMRLLAQRGTPDDGRVTKRRDVTVGYLDQSDVLEGHLDVGAAIVGDQADHEWASNPKIRDVMGGLVAEVDWHARVDSLSGGQKRRVALAKLLIGNDDVIMLDEPTNHLDVEGVAWLAEHLKQRWRPTEGGLLVVTHDRWFLDEISTRTWEVHDGIVDGFDGGYAAYVLARAERDRMAAVVEGKRQQLVKKELAWLRRGAPARTSKPKFRIEAANALIADVPEPRDSLALSKLATARLGKDVLDLENVSLELGDKPLFKGVTLRLAPGQRLGIVGVNGAGKTTLLRLLNGEVSPSSGRVKRGKTVQTAILSQDVRELDDVNHLRVTEVIEQEKRVVSVGGKEVSASQLVEQLGFTNQRQWTPVGDLSGGERRRLQLLRLLVGEPNVLMLDEPTNDLDTDTLAAVEDVLDGWPGTLVVVSHDRYLLERVTDTQLALLGDGKIRDLPGGVDQYLQLRRGAASSEGMGAKPLAAESSNGTTAAAGQDGPSPEEARQAKKDLTRIERQMTKTSSQIEKINQQMSEAGSKASVDFEKMSDLDAKLRELQTEQESLEEQWLAAAEVLGE